MTTGRMAVVERGGALSLYARAPRAAGWVRTPLRSEGRWPSWHPTRDLIAVSSLSATARTPRSAVEAVPVGDGVTKLLYASPPGAPPAIALRIPHYVLWAPNGNTLSMVVPGAEGLQLALSDVDGAFTGVSVAQAAPMFEAWSPDGRWLAFHGGQEMRVYDLDDRDSKLLADDAIGFRAPAFAAAGSVVAFARPYPPGVEVVGYDVESGVQQRLSTFEGGVALSTIPGSTEVSVALTVEADAGVFQQLFAIDTARPGTVRPILRGPFVAALWSPLGDRVAVVVPLQTGDGRYAVRVHTADGAFLAATEGFVPAQDLRTYLGFFDQYSQSHRLWAPGGSGLTISGRLLSDGVAASFSSAPTDYVWYWPAERGKPFELVGPGELAFFATH
ncbi:MAG: hypothetical protein ACKVVT_13835 [Dehalococcoidia bacterium]